MICEVEGVSFSYPGSTDPALSHGEALPRSGC